MKERWYEGVYRRCVVDMHITDVNAKFLAEFDADRYVEMLRLSQSQSVVMYAHSVVGKVFYPSRVGAAHHNLQGRNIVQEVIDRCHQHDIAVVLYMSLVWDTWAYRNHPDWQVVAPDGRGIADRSRSGLCCPNSPYREYTAALAREMAETFDVEGIRFDMTFWPAPCYCRHCRARFAEEVGGELPTVVNWVDPRWVAFQRRREAWLTEFAAGQTAAVKQVNPRLSVEHQASTFPHLYGWRWGVTTGLAAQNDFLQGDFYGGALEGSFARKLFYNLSPNRPAGFETSVAVSLANYTAIKPRELLRAKAYAALADGCAFIFIDSIDPEGTLNPLVYERIGGVFEETKACERYLGGELAQDVAVYLSMESKCDFADNGKRVDDPTLSHEPPHLKAALSACQSLRSHHIPFGVITDRNLDALARHPIVVLPNVLMMDAREIDAFRDYVRAGGCLYASKYTSLLTKDGRRQRDFLLGDVFGVAYAGETQESFTYIAPAEGAERLFSPYTRRHPAGLPGTQLIVAARPGVEVLGRVVLPYTDPADPITFVSLHNNPPGLSTDYPAVVVNRFGAGRALYAAGDLEAVDPHRDVFVNLIRLLAQPFSFEADAPAVVEVTLFRQPERRRFIVNLLNFQHDLPNVPVEGVRVRVRLGGKTPKRLLLLPSERALDFQVREDCLEFVAPRVETFAMFAVDYV